MSTKEENILPLIAAYLNKELTHAEQKILEDMLKEEEYEKIFLEHVGTYRNYRQVHFADNVNVNEAWKKTSSKLSGSLYEQEKTITKPIFSFRAVLKYAAIFVFVLTGIYFLKFNSAETQSVQSAVKDENAIIITLADGTKKIINTKSHDVLKNSSGQVVGRHDQNTATYSASGDTEMIQYNTISIPFGKRFTLYLSDGTKVDLNSGATFKYPQQFIAGKLNREVYVEGEAYFEVSKDRKHPFLVHSNNLTVKVLGTHFNFRAYNQEKSTSVVLAEGAVEVKSVSEGRTINLKADQMAVFNKKSNTLLKEDVFAENYTAWIDGRLIFRKVPLDFILEALERHFNVEIENQSTILKNSPLNANFGNDDLEKVMKYLEDDFGLKYKVKNSKIIVY